MPNSRTQGRGGNGRTGARAADGARDRKGGGRGRQGPWTEGGTRNRKGGGRGRNAAVEGGRGKDQEEGGGTGPWKEGGARTRREGEERGRGRREARTRKAGGPGPTVGAEGGTVATRSSISLARTGGNWYVKRAMRTMLPCARPVRGKSSLRVGGLFGGLGSETRERALELTHLHKG